MYKLFKIQSPHARINVGYYYVRYILSEHIICQCKSQQIRYWVIIYIIPLLHLIYWISPSWPWVSSKACRNRFVLFCMYRKINGTKQFSKKTLKHTLLYRHVPIILHCTIIPIDPRDYNNIILKIKKYLHIGIYLPIHSKYCICTTRLKVLLFCYFHLLYTIFMLWC